MSDNKLVDVLKQMNNGIEISNNRAYETKLDIQGIKEKLLKIEQEIDKLSESDTNRIWTAEDIYKMKENGYSWRQLVDKTKLSKSTLQRRVNNYKNSLESEVNCRHE